ncbi:MAG TPA: hypothetical protein VD913_03930, partial [bacterium]|nr:hypothetical protein [bacterium]
WWHLRDQIIGMIGGCAVVWAFHRSVRSNLFPNPQVITLTTQKGGFLFFAVVIPAVETFSVFGYWAFERSMPFTWQGYVLGLFFFLFFVTLSAMLLRADESWLEERGLDYLLLTSVMFFIWYVSGVAILKELIPAGIKRWEPAYTFFILYACILSVILPAKIRRKV